jgi:glutathionylspermidine synthase
MKLPWSAGARLRPDQWESVRMRLMFDCCKWDIQSEDHSVVADFPLILEQEEWSYLADNAEKLTHEVLAAERELLYRPDLHKILGLPESICRVLRKCVPEKISTGVARVMRFDFHFTPEGWRISEVNADVPGGFIEASGFVELMAEYYPGYSIPPNPAEAYEEAIAATAGEGGAIGLVHATAHCDDRQVMQYLAKGLQRRGLQAIVLSPNHLEWNSGFARIASSFAAVKPALLVRFFPSEWLPNLRPARSWEPWFCGGKTPMSNPGHAILIQSKRFPLIWNELKTRLPSWQSLLPETNFPSEISSGSQHWVLKPVFGRVGEDVAIAGVTEQRAYEEVVKDVKRHPHDWIAQRRFDTLPFETYGGLRYACLGVFTLDGKAVGAYGRIATKPLIDHDAQDIAILIRRKDHGENDRKRTV